jgi:hypothetical protein
MSQRVDASSGLFGGDAEARRDMSWRQDDWNHDLLSFYQALVHMRTSLPILVHGKRRTVHLDAEQQTYAYLRMREVGQELDTGDALAMFNLSENPQTLAFPVTLLPERAFAILAAGAAPVISRTRHQVEVTLAPLCGAVFCLKEA